MRFYGQSVSQVRQDEVLRYPRLHQQHVEAPMSIYGSVPPTYQFRNGCRRHLTSSGALVDADEADTST